MRELPFELVMEILARVPVKGLKRFTCVCKSWRSLFQDEMFIRQHMTFAPSRIMSFYTKSTPYSFIYENGLPETIIAQEVDLSSGDKSLFQRTKIIGYCDGFFCLLDLKDRFFAVWNPALRELRKLPVKTTRLNPLACLRGFGYDYLIEDYKIVMVDPIRQEDGCYEAQVLTVKSNRSRMIKVPSRPNYNGFCLGDIGTLEDENIFWKLYNLDFATGETSENIFEF